MLDLVIPDLTFPKMRYGPKQVPVDLHWLLYAGGAATHRINRKTLIDQGKLGPSVAARLPMVEAIHAHLNATLEKGGQPETLESSLTVLCQFYAYADAHLKTVTFATAQAIYVSWAASLGGRMKLRSAYTQATVVGALLAPALGTETNKLVWKTKLRKPTPVSGSADKQNLEHTKAFIQSLLAVVQGLSLDVVHGPLPVVLRFADNRTYVMKCGLKLVSEEELVVTKPSEIAAALARRELRSRNTSYPVRSTLINLRIEAELLLFISQTGANLAPTLQLLGTKFRYQTKDDYLFIRPWKARAGHNVEYRVHKEYRKYFDAYLTWRNALFPDDPDGLLFPFLADDAGPNPRQGDNAPEQGATKLDSKPRTNWQFRATRQLCSALGQTWVGTRTLRKAAGVWAERRKAGLGSQLLGNSPETFSRDYDQPNHQRAMVEITRFWRETELAIEAPGPGVCIEAVPALIDDAPHNAPVPDCVAGGGCLFCDHNRDQHSFEHAWKLASLRALLLRQLASERSADGRSADHPLMVQIDRIAAKLSAFTTIDSEHAGWVTEAEERMQEDHYHPFYTHKFQVLEQQP